MHKSCDISQVLVVHYDHIDLPKRKSIPNYSEYKQETVYIKDLYRKGDLRFDPLTDSDFVAQLYDKEQGYRNGYLLSGGLTPSTKNLNVKRVRSEPEVDPLGMRRVSKILNDI